MINGCLSNGRWGYTVTLAKKKKRDTQLVSKLESMLWWTSVSSPWTSNASSRMQASTLNAVLMDLMHHRTWMEPLMNDTIRKQANSFPSSKTKHLPHWYMLTLLKIDFQVRNYVKVDKSHLQFINCSFPASQKSSISFMKRRWETSTLFSLF